MTPIGLRHWIAALGVALAIHAALMVRLQLSQDLAPKPTGGAGVRIALAATKGPLQANAAGKGIPKEKPKPESKPESQKPRPKPTPKSHRNAAPAAQPKPRPTRKSAPVPKPAAQPKTKPRPQPKPQPKPKPAPKPKTQPTPQPKPKPKPKPAPEPKPAPQPKPKPKPVPKPKPKPKPERTPKPQPQPKPTPPTQSKRTPAPAVSSQPSRTRQSQSVGHSGGLSGASKQHATAPTRSSRTQSVSTGTVADTPPDYRAELRAYLAEHKTYPLRARREGLQGTVVLYFVMDRDGDVLRYNIRKSSGHPLLDEAVKKMIQSANPLPALPSGVSMQRLELTVPVTFRLR